MNSAINRKLKRLRKNVELLSKTLATKKGTAALRRGLDVTRHDLDQKFRRLAVEIVNNSCDIKELKGIRPALEEMKENIWLILNRVNAIERGN